MNDTLNNPTELDNGLEKWTAQEVSTQSDPIDDPGIGAAYVLKSFTFAFDPLVAKQIREKKLKPPTQQDLFNSVWPQLRIMLWGAGLVAVQEKELPPKMRVGKKKFTVVLVCEPKLALKGEMKRKAKSLNEYLP